MPLPSEWGGWTAPDPLTVDAVTLAVYLIEIQTAINWHRVELGQYTIPWSSISYLYIETDPEEPKTIFQKATLDSMKLYIEDLARDYGYGFGIEDPRLLGRDWTPYKYIRLDHRTEKAKWGHQLIQDMRQILENLAIAFWLETWSAVPDIDLSFASSCIGDKGAYFLGASNSFGGGFTFYDNVVDIYKKIEGGVFKMRNSYSHFDSGVLTAPALLIGHGQLLMGTFPISINNPIVYLVTDMTVSFDGSLSFAKSGTMEPALPYIHYVTVNIRLSGGKNLSYRVGPAQPGPGDFAITTGEFASFNRNLYEDYNTKYGSYPASTVWVRDIQFSNVTQGKVDESSRGNAFSISIDMTIDNIKFDIPIP